eukprot:239668_1
MGNYTTMTSSSSNNEISIDIIPDELQILIFSHLEIIQLIQTINILSKNYYRMVNKGSLIWKLLNINQLTIATYEAYVSKLNYEDYTSRSSDIYRFITINNKEFKNAPNTFLSKIKLIPLNLNELRIRMVLKPWCEHILHQKAMEFMSDLFENWLLIESVYMISFSSYPDNQYNNEKDEQYNNQTKLYTKIMEICKPIKLHFECAI